MNLLTINYEFPPQGGGAGVVMHDLLTALRARSDLRQTVLCGWDYRLGNPPDDYGIDFNFIPVDRKSVHQTGFLAIGQFLLRAAHALRRLDLNAFDLIHFHFSVPTGLLAMATRGKPYVCSLHGIDVPGFVTEEGALFQKLTAPANRRILSGASTVFAPSEELAALVRKDCPAARVRSIPHGVRAEAFAAKERYPTSARKFVTLARLVSWKRIDLLIRAVVELQRSIPDVTLDIFGDGEQRTALETLVISSGASNFVRLRGFASKEVVEASLSTFDAFVLPSVTEAFGLVFLEAMAAGLPVVGVNRGGPAEIIQHGTNGMLVERDRADELFDALHQLATVPGLAETMGRRARLAAVDRFSWDAVATQYFEAYQGALDNAPLRRE